MGAPFDAVEAERLAANALALSDELIDAGPEIRRVSDLHREALERSRAMADFHARMIGLWEYLARAQEAGDMELVRAAVAAIGRETRAEFGRRSAMG